MELQPKDTVQAGRRKGRPKKKWGVHIYQNGQEWGWSKPSERLRTERNAEKWLPDHPWWRTGHLA